MMRTYILYQNPHHWPVNIFSTPRTPIKEVKTPLLRWYPASMPDFFADVVCVQKDSLFHATAMFNNA
ncbi:MAG: hypothetical protein J7619_20455 [Dyadobacter sp.]|uniref:hypothetical protein n=1 Tax=Dyadobacter sp. TaxID=1914288 RepID=UPI001B115AC5|nr:hypothetical protein [Dyadobacter sp.]MBO9615088.1 hypothetical protein [Dyadobacter sp.]